MTPEEAQERVRAVFGNTVDVKPLVADVPEGDDSDSEVVDTITRICYFYPQYDLVAAEKLTNAQATALLVQADKQKAIEYYNMLLISAAPHTKKGQLVDKLIKQYKKIAQI